MQHKKYQSISGSWQQKEVAYMRTRGFDHPQYRWCVTEKVHGSNFSFYMDLDEVKVAKRSSFLKDGENFFNYMSMKESNGYKIRNLWNQLLSEGKEVEELIIYGELFGGYYPHPEVERVPGVQKIQKGVHYCPNINFYCFDIMLNGEFLPMTEVCRLCEIADIFYARILFTGTFDECLAYSNEFQTHIPQWLGLPLFDPNEEHVIHKEVFAGLDKDGKIIYEDKDVVYHGNICEGIVMKPLEDLRYGGEDGGRVIFKSKNDVYMETSREKKSIRKKERCLSEFAMDVLEKIAVYVNENRLRNVLSRFGSFTKKDFKKVFDAFKHDIYENFNTDYDDLKNMEAVDKREVDKVIGKLITEIWRPIFLSEAER